MFPSIIIKQYKMAVMIHHVHFPRGQKSVLNVYVYTYIYVILLKKNADQSYTPCDPRLPSLHLRLPRPTSAWSTRAVKRSVARAAMSSAPRRQKHITREKMQRCRDLSICTESHQNLNQITYHIKLIGISWGYHGDLSGI